MLNYTQLPYVVLQINGEDCQSFLQGIITQDIKKTNNYNSVYSLILNNKGRYLYNFFLTPLNDTFLLAVAEKKAEALKKFFNFYKLRSKVEIISTPYQVFIILQKTLALPFTENSNTFYHQEGIIFKDPRLADLGYIYLTKNLNFTTLNDIKEDTKEVENTNYTSLRYSLAVPEENELLEEKSIPIECGFDELNAISYTKGCYLGQEFTNSAKRVLEIRKRIIAFKAEAFLPAELRLEENNIYNDKQEKIAKVLGIHQNYILALARMSEVLKEDASFKIKGISITPVIPSWIKHFSAS